MTLTTQPSTHPATENGVSMQEMLRIQPLRAWRAVRRLIANKEDTQQVFEIMQALTGKSILRGYARLLDTEAGGRLAYLHPELTDKLQDPDWLAQFAPGTVGAHYRAFIAPRGLSAYGLKAESHKVPEGAEIERVHPVAWYARRMRDVHDIWHVLTGYSTDALGEACVVAFSYAQTKNFGFGFIALAGAVEFGRAFSSYPYVGAIRQAYVHGKKAAWLPAEDYEALLAEPLDAARRRLNIAPPTLYDSIPAAFRDQLPRHRREQAA